MHQNKSWLGLCPRFHCGSLHRFPRHPTWIVTYQPFRPPSSVITLFGFQLLACMWSAFLSLVRLCFWQCCYRPAWAIMTVFLSHLSTTATWLALSLVSWGDCLHNHSVEDVFWRFFTFEIFTFFICYNSIRCCCFIVIQTTLCLKKTHQLWNGIARNYKDRFWWHLAEIFKMLQNRVCMFQPSALRGLEITLKR